MTDTNSPSVPAKPLFDVKMLEFLVCPLTHSRLEYDAEAQELVSKAAGMAFPIRSGIPVMLASEARALES